ncbi:scavenger receptor class F member 1 [Aplochiton taeniatus]
MADYPYTSIYLKDHRPFKMADYPYTSIYLKDCRLFKMADYPYTSIYLKDHRLFKMADSPYTSIYLKDHRLFIMADYPYTSIYLKDRVEMVPNPNPILTSLGILLCCSLCFTQTLDPNGRNVCQDLTDPSSSVCCTGWRQLGQECSTPVCEGERSCQEGELCVFPGVCRCPSGYYGAHCTTQCPPEFWSPDCRARCPCHPHGRCHPVTGECTCFPNRWGPLCQHACKCTRHGTCHPLHGNCSCEEGWWSPTCAKPCQCSTGGAVGSWCDQATGGCSCQSGHWGQKCRLSCSCYVSGCHQRTGLCECQGGWWGLACDRRCNCDMTHSVCEPASGVCVCQPGYKGPFCNEPCSAGEYGSGCLLNCGRCKDGVPCSPVDGVCSACEPGWNGTRCDRLCPVGYHGDRCQEKCPRCRIGDACDPRTGKCWRCDPGWTGPRCDQACTDRMYGDACHFLCSPCFHGNCDHVTGRCVCQPGFQGESCNSTCPERHYGSNCSSTCDCGKGVGCHPITGVCPYSGRRALIAGLLVPLLLLVLAVLFCCVCCGGGGSQDGKDRVTVGEAGPSVRMKHHIYNVLANVSSAVPCISVWSSGLPRVTVSHHDPELTFNHSFIEPPSSGWMTEGSSFDTDEEEGEALYCLPPREDIPAIAGGEFQEMSSKCNMFLDPSGFHGDDMSLPFAIPRTSSIAKSKRPSVSFAEGTRFSPAKDLGAAPGPPRTKPKPPWGVLMLSALQAQAAGANPGEEGEGGGVEVEEEVVGAGGGALEDNLGASSEAGDPDSETRTFSNVASRKCSLTPAPPGGGEAGEKITTVYVTVGQTGRPVSKLEPSSSGPVQAILRRLGSLQKQKDQDGGRAKPRGAEAVVKPPRRKLGARASVWEQGGPAGELVKMRKPSRRKHTSLSSPGAGAPTTPPTEGAILKRPSSSILKSVPEGLASAVGSEVREETGQSAYLTVTDAVSLSEVITNQGVVAATVEEPNYENIMINHS